ncbi:cadherin-related family member 5 isoform X3 [Canis lupus dingo]|uniref:cadherin-related family member 5 isoform X3 n=1 Tax=Canis lupus familiaris TaxID=9615 RepID=UPI0018F4F22D|nr:cadherin-related family member 5 isoform X3 [Canis lupus familiaris]XP_048952662.1 cadherin-related family member 5 isoform X3 [Canis lupus dingo]
MGAWALLLPLLVATARAQVCAVSNNIFEVQENTIQSGPLAHIDVPAGQQVTLGSSSTPFAFRIQGTELFLNVTPDYEENTLLEAHLECKSGNTVVTQLRVIVFVLDVNDNPPKFPFKLRVEDVPEDSKVNTTVIPETELEAQDPDKDDVLFYTLQEVTPGAGSFFSLLGTNLPALRLDRPLDFYKWQNMSLLLLVRDTQEENAQPSHTATATLVLDVRPADLRPPWFLPCAYSDLYVCINAEYQGAIPTGHRLPAPLVLRPGPIYAVDGDRGVNQRVLYSIVTGQDDGTFAIDANSGNLTMTRSVPSPKTFTLLVKGEQSDGARYSVTWVTIEARSATGSVPQFLQSRYYGTVALNSAVGVEVRDTASPSLPLRVSAQDPDFPDLNSAITYRITNNTDFRMDGEIVRTAAQLTQEGVSYAEVEAMNTVTAGTARSVLEIQVLEPQGPAPTASPSGGSTPTLEPGTSQPLAPDPSRTPQPSAGPAQSQAEDRRFSAVDMAALGGVLGALLLLALIALVILGHKQFGRRLKCCSRKALDHQALAFDNQAFSDPQEANWAPAPRASPGPTRAGPPEPPEPTPQEASGSAAAGPAPGAPEAARDGGSPAAVRSILTKERRPDEGGYKAVWFGEDIGAEADVVVLNAPAPDAARAPDSGSEHSGDGDDEDGEPGGGSTYV